MEQLGLARNYIAWDRLDVEAYPHFATHPIYSIIIDENMASTSQDVVTIA